MWKVSGSAIPREANPSTQTMAFSAAFRNAETSAFHLVCKAHPCTCELILSLQRLSCPSSVQLDGSRYCFPDSSHPIPKHTPFLCTGMKICSRKSLPYSQGKTPWISSGSSAFSTTEHKVCPLTYWFLALEQEDQTFFFREDGVEWERGGKHCCRELSKARRELQQCR